MKTAPMLAAAALLASASAEEIRPRNAWMWHRGGTSAPVPSDGKGVDVRHEGPGDWSLNCFPRLDVRAGDRFVLEFDSEPLAPGAGMVRPCAVTRRADGEVANWAFASVEVKPGARGRTAFAVPHGVATVEPRFIGDGPVAARLSDIVLRRLPNVLGEGAVRPWAPAFSNETLEVRLSPSDAAPEVRDLRTGRVWRTVPDSGGILVKEARPLPSGPGATVVCLNASDLSAFTATYRLEGGELSVSLDGRGALAQSLAYPAAFSTRKGDRLVAPVNEGMGFPVDERHPGLWHEAMYSGHGLCMSFFGIAEDATGAGWMALVETPDDAAMDVRTGPDGLLRAGVAWDPSRGEFAAPRRMRYVFLAAGGHVAMAKRYRAHAKAGGRLVTFAEKAKRRPRVLDLLGAPNVWCWGDDERRNLEILEAFRGAGAKRILWSAGGSPDFVRTLAGMEGVLVGRYDIYQDIMDPKRRDELPGWHPDWVTEAFPHDINWAGPDPSQWRHGWPVDAKKGPRIDCAVMCDRQALPYARRRIGDELKAKPYNARFIDTTTASPWRECWNPAHPMTRTDSKVWKMKLLDLVSGEFGLVCGSETGHDAAVPFCDYFEGMLSIGPDRIDEAGRDMWRTVDEVPERVAKYQVGERYRLPLWELVYHDCAVAQWYWGDYNNKLPATWRRRDLFNALYGTPPMYLFRAGEWPKWRARMLASLKTSLAGAEASAGSEMTGHAFLSPDRTVQRTRFANGAEVTVNFGDRPFPLGDGRSLAPLGLRVEKASPVPSGLSGE